MKLFYLITPLFSWFVYFLFAEEEGVSSANSDSLKQAFSQGETENVIRDTAVSRSNSEKSTELSTPDIPPIHSKDAESFEGLPVLTFKVSRIIFSYGKEQSELPDLNQLGRASISLSFSEEPVSISSLMESKKNSYPFSLDDLHAIAQIALQYLKSEGFEGVVVFPDPQQIDPVSGRDLRKGQKGELRFVVWVSTLQQVKLRNLDLPTGLAVRIDQSLKAGMDANGWLESPLRKESFQFWKRYGTIPGISSRILLVPGDRPGTVEALLEAKYKKNPNTSIFLSNAGTDTLGNWIWGASYTDSRVSDYGDQFAANHVRSNTGARHSTSLSYRRPVIFPNLLETGLNFGISQYDASSFAITRIDFDGKTKFADWYLRWNPTQTEWENYSLSFELGLRSENLQAANSLLTGRADAHFLTPRAALQFLTNGKYLKTKSRIQVSGNLESIDKNDLTLLGGVQVEDQSRRIQIDYQEAFQIGKWLIDNFPNTFDSLWKDHLVVSRARLDYGLEKVRHLPQRQFITGGTGSVRGYPESPAAGDNGFFLSSEYRIPLPKFETETELGSVSSNFIPFVDWAETEVNQPMSYESDKSLLGAGVGLEMKFSNGLFSRLDLATPLREIKNSGSVLEGTRNEDHRIHALIRWDF